MGCILNCCSKRNNEKDIVKELTLYQQIGGEQALDLFVDRFYEKILDDDTLRPFFYYTSMYHQKKHQKRFLARAFGGPAEYTGKELYDAHDIARKSGLNESHFDLVARYLVDTCSELEIEKQKIQQILQIALNVKNDILGIKETEQDDKEHSIPQSPTSPMSNNESTEIEIDEEVP